MTGGNNSDGNRVIVRVKSLEDLIHKIQSFAMFRIAERQYSAELLTPQLVIDNKDLSTENAMAAAFVLYWGLEASKARRWHAQVEAAYRGWRDSVWLEIKQTPILDGKGNPKFPTDSHTEKLVHQHSEYGDWRGRLDDAQEAAENAEAVHEAFKVKAELLKTAQRLLHDEAGGPYMVVEDPRQTQVRSPQLGDDDGQQR